MILLMRLFALHAFLVVGVLIRQQLLTFQNNNGVLQVQAFTTLTSTSTMRNPMKHLTNQHRIKLSVFSSTKDKPSELSNEQQQQKEESIVVLKPSLTPIVVPVITTTTVDSVSVITTTTTVATVTSTEVQPTLPPPEQSEFNIWAARGLLLLVAAIWGTNFAVSLFIYINKYFEYIFCCSL